MGSARSLESWGKHGRFRYSGDIARGTRVALDRGVVFVVTPETYAALLAHFAGRLVAVGASRSPPRDSLGGWLRGKLPDVEVPAAFVGPILVREGAAAREGDEIRFS